MRTDAVALPLALAGSRGSFRLTVFVLALPLALGSGRASCSQQPLQPPPTFEGLLKDLSSAPADACRYPATDFSDVEDHLFDRAPRQWLTS